MAKYFHYCCDHSLNGILAAKGTLVPNPHPGRQFATERRAQEWGLDKYPIWVYPVVWVTDVDVHTREDAMLVGLGQVEGNLTECFRVEYRFRVPNVGLSTWKDWADANVPPELEEHRQFLETGYGCDPAHWWVSSRPITGCRLDHTYHAKRDRDWGPVGSDK